MLNLLFPKICNGCNSPLLGGEAVLCIQCRHDLPLTRFHETNNTAMASIFYGRFPLQAATALIQFQKRGVTQEIMHNLKYRGQKEIGNFFGQWLGAEIADMEPYTTIDMVIPVPLHRQKLKTRGYNQVAGFGIEIAKALNTSYRDDILLKVSKTSSQVFKERLMRFNAETVFRVNDHSALKNKHVLLVDDIVTTGATLESCAKEILNNTNATLSLATIAIA